MLPVMMMHSDVYSWKEQMVSRFRTCFVMVMLPALLICSFVPRLAAAAEEKEKLPNIVLIISDDQAWNDYGFMGHPDIKTPNLSLIHI